jgi:predicted SAM-dependent methyltransferase
MTIRERIRRALPLAVRNAGRRVVSAVKRDSVAAARRKARAYLASRNGRPACLHLGCGEHVLDGWLNVDALPHQRNVIAVNLRRRLRFLDDASVDFIYHEHFFEHLDRRSANTLLAECRRVLRDGGRMRISMPDLDRMVRRYLAGWADEDGEFREYRRAFFGEPLLDTPGEMLNLSFRGWEHRFVYGEKDIVRMLELNGFRNVRRVAHGESDAEALRGIESRSEDRDPLIVEAEK